VTGANRGGKTTIEMMEGADLGAHEFLLFFLSLFFSRSETPSGLGDLCCKGLQKLPFLASAKKNFDVGGRQAEKTQD